MTYLHMLLDIARAHPYVTAWLICAVVPIFVLTNECRLARKEYDEANEHDAHQDHRKHKIDRQTRPFEGMLK